VKVWQKYEGKCSSGTVSSNVFFAYRKRTAPYVIFEGAPTVETVQTQTAHEYTHMHIMGTLVHSGFHTGGGKGRGY